VPNKIVLKLANRTAASGKKPQSEVKQYTSLNHKGSESNSLAEDTHLNEPAAESKKLLLGRDGTDESAQKPQTKVKKHKSSDSAEDTHLCEPARSKKSSDDKDAVAASAQKPKAKVKKRKSSGDAGHGTQNCDNLKIMADAQGSNLLSRQLNECKMASPNEDGVVAQSKMKKHRNSDSHNKGDATCTDIAAINKVADMSLNQSPQYDNFTSHKDGSIAPAHKLQSSAVKVKTWKSPESSSLKMSVVEKVSDISSNQAHLDKNLTGSDVGHVAEKKSKEKKHNSSNSKEHRTKNAENTSTKIKSVNKGASFRSPFRSSLSDGWKSFSDNGGIPRLKWKTKLNVKKHDCSTRKVHGTCDSANTVTAKIPHTDKISDVLLDKLKTAECEKLSSDSDSIPQSKEIWSKLDCGLNSPGVALSSESKKQSQPSAVIRKEKKTSSGTTKSIEAGSHHCSDQYSDTKLKDCHSSVSDSANELRIGHDASIMTSEIPYADKSVEVLFNKPKTADRMTSSFDSGRIERLKKIWRILDHRSHSSSVSSSSESQRQSQPSAVVQKDKKTSSRTEVTNEAYSHHHSNKHPHSKLRGYHRSMSDPRLTVHRHQNYRGIYVDTHPTQHPKTPPQPTHDSDFPDPHTESAAVQSVQKPWYEEVLFTAADVDNNYHLHPETLQPQTNTSESQEHQVDVHSTDVVQTEKLIKEVLSLRSVDLASDCSQHAETLLQPRTEVTNEAYSHRHSNKHLHSKLRGYHRSMSDPHLRVHPNYRGIYVDTHLTQHPKTPPQPTHNSDFPDPHTESAAVQSVQKPWYEEVLFTAADVDNNYHLHPETLQPQTNTSESQEHQVDVHSIDVVQTEKLMKEVLSLRSVDLASDCSQHAETLSQSCSSRSQESQQDSVAICPAEAEKPKNKVLSLADYKKRKSDPKPTAVTLPRSTAVQQDDLSLAEQLIMSYTSSNEHFKTAGMKANYECEYEPRTIPLHPLDDTCDHTSTVRQNKTLSEKVRSFSDASKVQLCEQITLSDVRDSGIPVIAHNPLVLQTEDLDVSVYDKSHLASGSQKDVSAEFPMNVGQTESVLTISASVHITNVDSMLAVGMDKHATESEMYLSNDAAKDEPVVCRKDTSEVQTQPLEVMEQNCDNAGTVHDYDTSNSVQLETNEPSAEKVQSVDTTSLGICVYFP